MIDANDLHAAADHVGANVGSPQMDALANAGAAFLSEANITDEDGTPIEMSRYSLGYGIMLGYIAAYKEMGVTIE